MFSREGKTRRYIHNKTTIEDKGIKAEIAEDGKVKIIEDHTDDTFDEVTVPASMIFKIANMLRTTRKVHWVDAIKEN